MEFWLREWWGEYLADEYLRSEEHMVIDHVSALALALMAVLFPIGWLVAQFGLGGIGGFLAIGVFLAIVVLGSISLCLGWLSLGLAMRYALAMTLILPLLKWMLLRRCRAFDPTRALRDSEVHVTKRVHLFSTPVIFLRLDSATGGWMLEDALSPDLTEIKQATQQD